MTDAEVFRIAVDLLGWIGSAMLVGAYWSISQGKLGGQTWTYQILNLVGSIFLIVNTVYYGAYPSSAVNAVWVIIGIQALLLIRRQDENAGA